MLNRTTKSGIKPKCAVDGCLALTCSKGYCERHYRRAKKYGDPLYKAVAPGPKPIESCSVDGCNNAHSGKGFCGKHYQKFLKYGDPLFKFTKPKQVCSIDGCNNAYEAHGLCNKHYLRLRYHGDPSICFNERGILFVKEAVKLARNGLNKCIEWPFTRKGDGRGHVNIGGESVLAYRLSFALFSNIPLESFKGKEIAHAPIECHNPRCINPNHLRLATRKENCQDKILDGTSARGEKHPKVKLTEENVRDIFHSKLSYSILSKNYGVSKATISSIKAGRNWGWLDKGIT